MRQASDADNASLGWVAQLYQDFAVPTANVSSIVASQEPRVSATARLKTLAADVPPKRRGANTRPTAALVAAACQKTTGHLAAGSFPAAIKPVSQRPSLRLIGRARHGSTIKKSTTEKRKKRGCVGRRPSMREKAVAEVQTVSSVSCVPVMAVDPGTGRGENAEAPTERAPTPSPPPPPPEKGKGGVEIPQATGGIGSWGASRRKKEGSGRKIASACPSTVPAYNVYSSGNTSFQAECKRRALLDLARADMDRVNHERDFLNKHAGFDDATAAHSTIHKRWMESTKTLEAACKASSVYFEAQERAGQKHVAACRKRQAEEVGVTEAVAESALAQRTLQIAEEAFHAAKTAHLKGRSATTVVVMKAPENYESISDRCDDAGPSSQRTLGKSCKRSRSNVSEEPPSFATSVPNNTCIGHDWTAEAKPVVGGGGSRGGEGASEERCRPTKSCRSTTGIHGLSEEEERHSHVERLQVQREISARTASRAAVAVAEAPGIATEVKEAHRTGTDGTPHNSTSTAAALEVGQRVGTSTLAVPASNMNDAIEVAKRASANVGSAKAAFDLSGAVRTEAETAVAHQTATVNATPYVSWVNNEVARERDLNCWTKELMGAASRAWDAREEARKKLNEAGGAISMAVRVLKSFSPGGKVDVSRYALFKAVAEARGGRGGGCGGGTQGGGSWAGGA